MDVAYNSLFKGSIANVWFVDMGMVQCITMNLKGYRQH